MKINVIGIHCEKCVARIEKAFKNEGIEAKVDLESKSVDIDKNDYNKVVEILDDLGFDIEK